MTNTWQDIKNANVVLVMGGNAAEAHPCGFKWVIEAKIENGAKLVVIDPRFTRTASVADVYAPIRPGTDIAFLSGVIRYLLEKDQIQHEYVRAYTNASLIVKDGFGFEDGLFTGYDEEKRAYDKSSWDYEKDDQGFAKVDDTWQNPRCVINLLRKHVDRYTPEMVSRICGTPQDKFLQICELVRFVLSRPDKALTSLFALGWTQHSVGRAEHPHDGDGAAAARQHRRGGRRHERAARPFQHPGLDRRRAPVERDARLSHFAARHRRNVRRLHEDAAFQALAARVRSATGRTTGSSSSASRRRSTGTPRPPTTTGPTTGCRNSTSRSTTSSRPSR